MSAGWPGGRGDPDASKTAGDPEMMPGKKLNRSSYVPQNSDVLFTPLDSGGVWRLTIARELKAAGLNIDMNKAV